MAGRPRGTLLVENFIILLMILGHPCKASDDFQSISVQAGWYSIEVDYVAPFGMFASTSLPWLITAIDSETFPLAGKIGYQFPISKRLNFRVGTRHIFVWDENPVTWIGSLEIGFRYVSLG